MTNLEVYQAYITRDVIEADLDGWIPVHVTHCAILDPDTLLIQVREARTSPGEYLGTRDFAKKLRRKQT